MTEATAAKTLLITGSSGFLGWNVCLRAVSRYRVFGVHNNHPCTVTDVVAVRCDLTSFLELKNCFEQIRPAAVIHTAAAADPNFCQMHPHESAAINVTATVNIARLCTDYSIPFIFTSSDLVFDGKHPPYHENDNVCPLSLYGEQKAEAEEKILAACPGAVVCRMPLMYGDAPAHAKSFIHPMISALTNSNELSLFTDEYRTPVWAADAADGLLLAVEKATHGIYHLGGPERLSRFDTGLLLAGALQVKHHIKPIMQKDIQMAAPRAADVSLDSSKAYLLGFNPQKMAAVLPALSVVNKNRQNSIPSDT